MIDALGNIRDLTLVSKSTIAKPNQITHKKVKIQGHPWCKEPAHFSLSQTHMVVSGSVTATVASCVQFTGSHTKDEPKSQGPIIIQLIIHLIFGELPILKDIMQQPIS